MLTLEGWTSRSRRLRYSSPQQQLELACSDLGPSSQQESVELPLTHPEYYEEMGIRPPKGVILYGAPGTGKTLLVKAVANHTSATFLRVCGSELIQKYLVSAPPPPPFGCSCAWTDLTFTINRATDPNL